VVRWPGGRFGVDETLASVGTAGSASPGLRAACLLAALLVSAPDLSAEEPPYKAYLAAVERSCVDRGAAVRALSRWSFDVLESVPAKLRECEQRRSSQSPSPETASSDPGEGCSGEPPRWAAAVMLHTHCAFTSCAGPGSQLFHLSLAARLQEQIDDDAFRRRWFLAAALGSLHGGDLRTARSYLTKGLEQFEDDPALLVALGASHEAEERRRRLEVRASGSGAPKRTRDQVQSDRGRLLQEAADLYEKALSHDSGRSEAHLRLGRVQLLLGRSDEGLARLQWVTEHAEEADLVYLAHLFIGRERMRSNELEAALASYRAALQADARGQAALVAASHALRLRGDPIAAGELLEERLTGRRSMPAQDSWWDYPESRPPQILKLLRRLRAEACR
jgi:hypothetical protein